MQPVRDYAFERQATREFAPAALKGKAELLVLYAEGRAARGVRSPHLAPDAEVRSMRIETLEELADARNYLVWWLEDIRQERAVGDVDAVGQALAAVIVAWGALT